RFDWEINADPRISRTIVYWNQRADSIIIDVNRTQGGRTPFSYDLENLSEGTYTFEFITRDDQGHLSMPTELAVAVFGDFYIESLGNSGVASVTEQCVESVLFVWKHIA